MPGTQGLDSLMQTENRDLVENVVRVLPEYVREPKSVAEREEEIRTCGWKAPPHKPYQALGTPVLDLSHPRSLLEAPPAGAAKPAKEVLPGAQDRQQERKSSKHDAIHERIALLKEREARRTTKEDPVTTRIRQGLRARKEAVIKCRAGQTYMKAFEAKPLDAAGHATETAAANAVDRELMRPATARVPKTIETLRRTINARRSAISGRPGSPDSAGRPHAGRPQTAGSYTSYTQSPGSPQGPVAQSRWSPNRSQKMVTADELEAEINERHRQFRLGLRQRPAQRKKGLEHENNLFARAPVYHALIDPLLSVHVPELLGKIEAHGAGGGEAEQAGSATAQNLETMKRRLQRAGVDKIKLEDVLQLPFLPGEEEAALAALKTTISRMAEQPTQKEGAAGGKGDGEAGSSLAAALGFSRRAEGKKALSAEQRAAIERQKEIFEARRFFSNLPGDMTPAERLESFRQLKARERVRIEKIQDVDKERMKRDLDAGVQQMRAEVLHVLEKKDRDVGVSHDRILAGMRQVEQSCQRQPAQLFTLLQELRLVRQWSQLVSLQEARVRMNTCKWLHWVLLRVEANAWKGALTEGEKIIARRCLTRMIDGEAYQIEDLEATIREVVETAKEDIYATEVQDILLFMMDHFAVKEPEDALSLFVRAVGLHTAQELLRAHLNRKHQLNFEKNQASALSTGKKWRIGVAVRGEKTAPRVGFGAADAEPASARGAKEGPTEAPDVPETVVPTTLSQAADVVALWTQAAAARMVEQEETRATQLWRKLSKTRKIDVMRARGAKVVERQQGIDSLVTGTMVGMLSSYKKKLSKAGVKSAGLGTTIQRLEQMAVRRRGQDTLRELATKSVEANAQLQHEIDQLARIEAIRKGSFPV